MSVASDIVPYLQQVPPLDQLPPEVLEQCAKDIVVKYHVKGDKLGQFKSYSGAQKDDEDILSYPLYLIRSGAVALKKTNDELLERRGEGELFGHPIHFNLGLGEYQAQANEDTLLWFIPEQRVTQLCHAHPGLKHWLLSASGERLQAQAKSNARYIRDLRLRAPITAKPQDSVIQCAQHMSQHNVSSLPILDEGQLVGIITDRDLRARLIAKGLSSDTSVSQIMTSNPVTAQPSDNVEDALVVLLRHGIHHLPVIEYGEDATTLYGVVTAGDLMRVHAPHPLRLVRDIGRATQVQEIVQLARQGPALLAKLANDLKDVSQVGRIASLITDACTKRLLELAEKELGTPPMSYTWLAFGSQARLEQGLISDQDNGMLIESEPDANDSEYFLQLSKAVCDGLAECGYTYCNGGVMAMGEWRMPQQKWRDTFRHWIAEPEPKSVMHCSIFFDMRPVHGDLAMAEQLRHDVLKLAQENRIFLRFLAAESMTHKPPLGFFRQFVQEQGGDHSHGLNLKQRGVIPVVDLARVLALEGALPQVHTEERLLAAAQKGLTTAEGAANLIQAQRFISRIRLEHQSRQLERGETPNHLVDPAKLSSLHRRYLRSAFNVVRDAQQSLAQRFLLR